MNEYVDNEARKAKLVGKTVTMAHGAGGHQTSELIDMIFKAHFDNPDLTADDAAVLTPPVGKMAVSTDGFIVSPAFFPGGNIGKLSICGTVNLLIVHDHRNQILGQLHIKLDSLAASLHSFLKRQHCILRIFSAETTMSKYFHSNHPPFNALHHCEHFC